MLDPDRNDDERADEILNKLDQEITKITAMGMCPRCGAGMGYLTGAGLCGVCTEDKKWSIGNRRICDLLHRGIDRPWSWE